ncbi:MULTISPECIES: hypothetical protein [unclassified Pseudomonas]|uniref:hypothetical protein n=1 Tax=unclassified Pseudomonas TaxID=196821 RepID=UPI000A1DFD0C|nr:MULTISPECIES: hypothetical protein [unclassified Pseudomonas]MDI2141293.1 hypothetical protein [Pseudomonas sp. ITA]
MASIPYNIWYDETYDAIFEMANWEELSADIPKKAVCIYSWMPHSLMSTRHVGGRPKWSCVSLNDVESATLKVSKDFSEVSTLTLQEANIKDCENIIHKILTALIPLFGTVATSKYLHFSAPKFFPMWDRNIRISRGHDDTVDGYIEYMQAFKEDLEVPSKLHAALTLYPENPVRGWDMANMRGRVT